MSKDGWASVHRQIEDNFLWFLEPFTKAQAWVDLFINANHKDGIINIRGNIVKIKRGQIGWSELTMSKRWKWSKNKVRRFLKLLETEQQIKQDKDRFITTIITIINYEKYQKKTADDTAERQQKDSRRYINNNDNNENNYNYVLYKNFLDYSDRRKIKVSLNEKKYLELRKEFKDRLDWYKQIKKCIDWLYDNGMKNISSSRIRNWMEKSIQFEKDAKLKKQQEYQDKQSSGFKKINKVDPVWEPPV